jgi:hypothetical protein
MKVYTTKDMNFQMIKCSDEWICDLNIMYKGNHSHSNTEQTQEQEKVRTV